LVVVNYTDTVVCYGQQTLECHVLVASDVAFHRPPFTTQPLWRPDATASRTNVTPCDNIQHVSLPTLTKTVSN